MRNILSAAPGRMNVIAPMPFAASALALFYLRRPWLAYSQMRKKTAAAKYAKKRRQSPTRLVRKK